MVVASALFLSLIVVVRAGILTSPRTGGRNNASTTDNEAPRQRLRDNDHNGNIDDEPWFVDLWNLPADGM
jgi:hypothetical protein